MNKAELAAAVAAKTGLKPKDADKAVSALTEVIAETLAKGEKVQLTGFGTFEVREKAAREGTNFQSKEKIMIPATKAPAFKAGATLKKAVK